MIYVTRLDGTELVVNCELIATIEKTPDTMITLINGQRLLVKEPVAELIERTVGYRHRVYRGPGLASPPPGGEIETEKPQEQPQPQQPEDE